MHKGFSSTAYNHWNPALPSPPLPLQQGQAQHSGETGKDDGPLDNLKAQTNINLEK